MRIIWERLLLVGNFFINLVKDSNHCHVLCFLNYITSAHIDWLYTNQLSGQQASKLILMWKIIKQTNKKEKKKKPHWAFFSPNVCPFTTARDQMGEKAKLRQDANM